MSGSVGKVYRRMPAGSRTMSGNIVREIKITSDGVEVAFDAKVVMRVDLPLASG